MSKITSREIRLASRPEGIPTTANFTLAQTKLGPRQDRQVLVRNLFMSVITKRLTMKGLIVRDWLDHQGEFEKEVGGYFRAGKLKHKETVVEGIGQAMGAFIGLFAGKILARWWSS